MMPGNIIQINECGYCVVTIDANTSLAPILQQLSGCSIIGMCSAGNLRCELNMELCDISVENCVCVSRLVQLRRTYCSPDLKLVALVVSDEMIFNCTQGISTLLLKNLFLMPIVPIGDDRFASMLTSMLATLSTYSTLPVPDQNPQFSASMVRNIILLLIQLNENASHSHDVVAFTSADRYFRRFMQLVSENIRTQHEVLFYASQLCITPKYLSEICKAKTGKKAKEIISALLLRAIKTDLLISGLTVKELAARYGFANQSSMGKFFRKMTGLSPLNYRRYDTPNVEADRTHLN